MNLVFKLLTVVACLAMAPVVHAETEDTTVSPAESTTFTNGIGASMIWVAPGSVKGTEHAWTSQSYKNRGERDVTIEEGYYLAATELTQAQWEKVMGNNPSKTKGADLPVEMVSWDEAREFCRRLNQMEHRTKRLPAGYVYTLPTETQWEYACRTGSTADFVGSLDEQAWYRGNAERISHSVGKKQPNAWGFYDMYGNVREWCLNKIENYEYMAVRGGSWASGPDDCRAGARDWAMSNNRSPTLGFRVALVKRQAVQR